jgi:hypothetical protein
MRQKKRKIRMNPRVVHFFTNSCKPPFYESHFIQSVMGLQTHAADIIDNVDGARHHVISFETREGSIPLEISIPSYVFRNLNLLPGKKVRVALRDESLWVMG